jgi:UDP-N-acetylglucosamine--N-acetylmuramyl-(pentapeptide) pyrophosphoryl-undecaprenol N-acetylglucosamine transferase
MNRGPVLIMAGGTGGHVFPALALARALRERSCEVVWLGTRRGIEARLVPAAGIDVEWIAIGGLRGKGLATLVAAPFHLLRSLWQSLAVMRRRRPAVVVGLGGFVTGPGGLAAWLARRPLVIHEQNAVAGFTNRILARLASQVLEAFPGSFGAIAPHARTIGNPVRREFFELPEPQQRFAARSGPTRILVVGGSQGATRLNAVLPQALAQLADLGPEVRHQAGERWLADARAAYEAVGVRAEVLPFIDDIAAAYAWADLVVCRSGALTVSELAAAGVAAVLVPFAAAVDDHQTRNAAWLLEAGAAVLIPERELQADSLARQLRTLCTDRGVLLRMASAARRLARPAATEDLVVATLAAGGIA